jgi:hypothetical protein
MRNCFTSLGFPLLFAVTLLVSTSRAQVTIDSSQAIIQTSRDSSFQPYSPPIRIELEGAYGSTSIGGGVLPISLLWGGSVQYYGNLFSFRSLNSYEGSDSPLPSEFQHELSILYGRATYNSHLFASASIGIAYINFLARGDYLRTDSLQNIQYYSQNYEHAIGLAYQAQLMYTMLPYLPGDAGLAIGITIAGNESRLPPNFAVLLTIEVIIWP